MTQHAPQCEAGCTGYLYDEEAVECDCLCHKPTTMPQPAKNTPGPWTWDIMPHELRADDRQGTVLLRCRDDEPTEANARLIAAAPELLEAIENLLTAIDAKPDYRRAAVGVARAAIAKATGG